MAPASNQISLRASIGSGCCFDRPSYVILSETCVQINGIVRALYGPLAGCALAGYVRLSKDRCGLCGSQHGEQPAVRHKRQRTVCLAQKVSGWQSLKTLPLFSTAREAAQAAGLSQVLRLYTFRRWSMNRVVRLECHGSAATHETP